MIVCETERLRLRYFSHDDAAFIIKLLNDPSFIANIADKNVRTTEDAIAYIKDGPIASYEQFGFGLNLVELKESDVPIGMCGLLKRDILKDADLGYAFLPEYWSKGYALESALAVMDNVNQILDLKRVVAVTSRDNQSSIRLLEKIGFRYEKMVLLYEDKPEAMLFGYAF